MFHLLPARIAITRLSSSITRRVYFSATPTRLNHKICGQISSGNSKKLLSTVHPRSSDSTTSELKENDSCLSEETKVNPPKKRGRKPKIQSEFETPEPPKKRGRKKKSQNVAESENSAENECQKSKDIEFQEPQVSSETTASEAQNITDRTDGNKLSKEGALNGTTKRNTKVKSSKKKTKAENIQEFMFSALKHPLTKSEYYQYLHHIHSNKKEARQEILENRKYDVKNRVNIIDSKLCDDTIERLAPSLEKHKGCDIIDLNPGIGLWSSKLHEFLQPRTHILMEPHPHTFMPVLKPLLDAPNSKYRYIPESGMDWAHLEKALSPEFLPHQPVLEVGDPRLKEVNNTLLVTANIGTNQPRRYLGFFSLAAVVLYQFMTAIRTCALFHKYGKVRLLLWMNLSDAKVVPKSVSLRRKASLEAMASCEHIEIVVEGDEEDYVGREMRLDIESVRIIEEKMKKKGIRIPEGRESRTLQAMRAGKTGTEESELSPECLQKELQDMQESFARGDFQKDNTVVSNFSNRKLTSRNTAEYDRMVNLGRRYRRRVAKTMQLFELADEREEIEALYKKSRLASSPEIAEDLHRQAKAKTNDWKERISSLSPFDNAELLHMCDNRRIFYQNPPGLFWDRREAEPLIAHANEFYPNKVISLIDLQPSVVYLFAENPLAHDVFLYFTMQMCLVPAQNLREALDSLAPGALDWLVAECPSLTDPLRNGFPDLELFSARCITLEILMEMTEAWIRWPFRPTREELLHRLGSEAFYDDSENNDPGV